MVDLTTAPQVPVDAAPVAGAVDLATLRLIAFKAGGTDPLYQLPVSRILDLISSAGLGLLRFATIALRNANTSQADGMLCYVFNNNGDEADPANGFYQWDDVGNAWVSAAWVLDAFRPAIQDLIDGAEATISAAQTAGVAAVNTAKDAALVLTGADVTAANDAKADAETAQGLAEASEIAASAAAVEALAALLPDDVLYLLPGNPGLSGATSVVVNEFGQIVQKAPVADATEASLIDLGQAMFVSPDWSYPMVAEDGSVQAGLRKSGLWHGERGQVKAIAYPLGISPAREVWAKVQLPGGWTARKLSLPGSDISDTAPGIVQTGNMVSWWDETAAEIDAELLLPGAFPAGVTRVYLVPAYGQSNASYYSGSPLQTTAPDHQRSLMFNGGHIQGDLLPFDLDRMAGVTQSFAQMIKHPLVTGQFGESILPGLGYALASRVAANEAVFTATAAVGGFGIVNLLPTAVWTNGMRPYRRLLQIVRRLKVMCDLAGIELIVPAVVWVQGETDGITAAATYETHYNTIRNQADADIRAITGQSGAVIFVANPVSSWTKNNVTTSGAQLVPAKRAIEDASKFSACAPLYYEQFAGLHDLGPSRRNRGEITGHAIADIIGGLARPFCYAISAVRTGTNVVLTFPRAVTLDTSVVTDPGNFGIRFFQTGGNSVTVTAVAVDADPTKINVTLSAVPTGTAQTIGIADLGVANPSANIGRSAGPRCCIREAASNATAKNGTLLYRYCVPQTVAVS